MMNSPGVVVRWPPFPSRRIRTSLFHRGRTIVPNSIAPAPPPSVSIAGGIRPGGSGSAPVSSTVGEPAPPRPSTLHFTPLRLATRLHLTAGSSAFPLLFSSLARIRRRQADSSLDGPPSVSTTGPAPLFSPSPLWLLLSCTLWCRGEERDNSVRGVQCYTHLEVLHKLLLVCFG